MLFVNKAINMIIESANRKHTTIKIKIDLLRATYDLLSLKQLIFMK